MIARPSAKEMGRCRLPTINQGQDRSSARRRSCCELRALPSTYAGARSHSCLALMREVSACIGAFLLACSPASAFFMGRAVGGRVRGAPGLSMVLLPKGSPYASPEDEPNPFPKYKPLKDFPGLCVPGSLTENAPYELLPDEYPVPEPHFHELEWHVLPKVAHPAPQAIVEFVDSLGLWITAEELGMTADKRDRGSSKSKNDYEDVEFVDDTIDDDTDVVGDDQDDEAFLDRTLGLDDDADDMI
jgi:hypothetical protein